MMHEKDVALYTKPDKPTRTRRRNLEKFVSSLNEAPVGTFDEEGFQNLVDQMSTLELQAFWFYFAANRSFNVSETSGPHWHTKTQLKAFNSSCQNLSYNNIKKDDKGHSFVDRTDFIAHIKKHIKEIITQNQENKEAYEKLPLIVRIRDKFGIAFILVFIFTIPISIISKKFEMLMSIIWFGLVFIFPIFIYICHRLTKKQCIESTEGEKHQIPTDEKH